MEPPTAAAAAVVSGTFTHARRPSLEGAGGRGATMWCRRGAQIMEPRNERVNEKRRGGQKAKRPGRGKGEVPEEPDSNHRTDLHTDH